ncbi:Extracellular exo-alpha-(1-_5)-L-arabinofuranosidase [Fusarium oxysporum f. sp. narcissi]|uniref:non-reducing end alpha-L-arabinofuranosidase n=1 Tax=Fusarium oxysporum f. sp. narcissi TaxID=451672 RepID=A0A4Q2UYW3_FUSOX|nr:Extracellular exo-alpha-(1->5)-L-arabinofuranosidase [Fusarium oxysporum f. sp. narcissi]
MLAFGCRNIFALGALLCLLSSTITLVDAQSPAAHYNNYLVYQRADPHIVKHSNGWYYFTASVPEYDRVILRRSRTIQGLTDAEEVTIWDKKDSDAGVGYVWAPELHYIGDKWYIYFALGRKSDFDIRIFVLEGTGDDAVTADWIEKAWVETDWDTFSLDATTFEVDGTRYLCWAQSDPTWSDANTSIMLAPMLNPWTLKLPAVAISRPELAWERVRNIVNEGPYALVKKDKVWLTYSASSTDQNYVMGLLSADYRAELMNPAVWNKSQEPIFKSNANTSQYGPGHNSFTISEDGKSDILVYHSRQYRDINGEPLNNPDRHTRVQKLYWKADGSPNFGIPVPDGRTPIRLRSFFNPKGYIAHDDAGLLGLQDGDSSLAKTQFRVISPGLKGDGTVSLESTDRPGSFIMIDKAKLRLGDPRNSKNAHTFASFVQRPGLLSRKGVSFEVVGKRGYFIQVEANNDLAIAVVKDRKQRRQATFYNE